MYFLKQITKQINNSVCLYNQESWPGSHDFDAAEMSAEAARRETEEARPEAERLAEIEATATETTAEMRTRMGWMREEQGRITQAEEWVPREKWEWVEAPEEEPSDIDDVMEQAAEIAENLWFEEFQIESDEQAEEFRQTLLQGLDLTGNETPEELDTLIQAEFEALKTQRLAELDALENEIDTELEDPATSAARRAELEWQRNAIGAMRNTYSPNGAINGPHGTPYTWGIGEPLTPELLAEYGETGHELASWLQSNGFPVYNGQPNYCGQNVGEALNAFGIQWLPGWGRHGYAYAQICASRPSQFKQIECSPQEAPAWAIISYQQNSGGRPARQQYGHVEIALWENRWFYFGTVAGSAWGSQRPPHPGSYTIWMPTSKTA